MKTQLEGCDQKIAVIFSLLSRPEMFSSEYAVKSTKNIKRESLYC